MKAGTFGSRLRTLRKGKGLTLDALEELSGVSKGFLSKIEAGKASPSVEVARRIARALEVSVSDLLGEEGPQEEAVPGGRSRALRDFIRARDSRGEPLQAEEIRLLEGIRFRGKTPRTAAEFETLLRVVKLCTGERSSR
ncbi:MAG: helix-turn-helix transcriptional regulator [Planctomycetes bacterium]|nr:helix-turn-helix transcriptional regulator [Planctomycetota bacterium]